MLVRRAWLKLFVWLAATVFLLLLLLEIGARFLVPANPEGLPLSSAGKVKAITQGMPPALEKFLRYDPRLGWSLQPGLDKFLMPAGAAGVFGPDRDFTITTNALGLRGGPITPKGTRRRILAIGDSTTFGWGIDDGETWPAQLETILNGGSDGGAWQVINAGVNAYSSYQGLRYLEERGFDLEPDIVVASFWFNDGMPWWGMSDAEAFRRLGIERWDGFFRHSRLYVALKLVALRIHPPQKLDKTKQRPRLSPAEFEHTLAQMNRTCTSKNIPLVYLLWPLADQVEQKAAPDAAYQDIIAKVAQQTGMPLVNPLDAFAAAAPPLYVDRIHGNGAACRIAAELLAEKIRKIIPIGTPR